MKELIRTNDMVLLSSLKAALACERIEVFEFDGQISDVYGGIEAFQRRLMVLEKDVNAAQQVVRAVCPELIE